MFKFAQVPTAPQFLTCCVTGITFTFSVCTFYRYEEKCAQNIHSSEILLGAYIALETQNHAGAGLPQGRRGAAGHCRSQAAGWSQAPRVGVQGGAGRGGASRELCSI